jgi:protocatechuate 3,4-dioxygenase beta subunit
MKKNIKNGIAKYYFGSFNKNQKSEKISRPIYRMVSLLITLCLLCGQILALNNTSSTSSPQSPLVSIGIMSFQDESGLNVPPAFGQKIAQELHRKLIQNYKDILPRILTNNPASANPLPVVELAELGKQSGMKFIIRGGLLAFNAESTEGETKATIQIYADVIAMETTKQTSTRAEGAGSQQGKATNKQLDLNSINFASNEFRNSAIGQALSNAIEQLATAVYQAMIAPQDTPVASTPTESNPASATPGTTQTEAVQSAETDEELQQLMAQAEAITTNNAGASTDSLNAINQGLQNLKAALSAKAQLLEQAKDTTPADQEIMTRKQELQTAISTAMQQVSSSDPATTVQQPTGEKKNLLSSIGGYLGEAVGILQKIQEMRSLLRSGNESSSSDQNIPTYSGGDQSVPYEEPTTEVNGVVTEGGSPVEGATVTEPESGATATTDSNGSYKLQGVAAGRLAKLVIAKTGKQVGAGQIDLIRGRAAVADFDLKASANGNAASALRVIPSTVMVNALKTQAGNTGVLKGVVRDPQGKPIPRALVNLKGIAMARTDSQGQYTFMNVPAGQHQLNIQKSGLMLKSQQVQVMAKKSNESQIQYAASERTPKETLKQSVIIRGSGATLRGKVFDNDKNPLAGVKITAIQASSAVSVLSNEKGKFELRDLKQGQYRLLVSKAGFDNNTQTVQLAEGKAESLDVLLKKSSSVTAVKIIEAQRIRREEARTQPNNNASRIPVANRTPEPAKGQLTGRIVDAQSGKPVAGAIISLQGQAAAKSDTDGIYAIANLPQGNYRLNINKSGFAEQAKATSVRGGNATREDFSLRKEVTRVEPGNIRVQPTAPTASGQLRGQIMDAKTGRPLAGANIYVANRQAAVTNQAGVFTVSNLQPGNYPVVVKMAGYADAGGTVAIRSGEAATASFRLNPRTLVIRPRNN